MGTVAQVLVADDAAIVRHVMREMLEAAGHEVVDEASSGVEAIEKFEAERPDVAILDVGMPELDGITAAEYIRRNYPWARLVLASVFANDTRLRRARALGGIRYIMKPFSVDELLEAVEQATERRPIVASA